MEKSELTPEEQSQYILKLQDAVNKFEELNTKISSDEFKNLSNDELNKIYQELEDVEKQVTEYSEKLGLDLDEE